MNNAKYLKETREKALDVAELSHTGREAKDIIKELVNITVQVESIYTDRVDNSVDQRMLQKRYEALKIEQRDVQKKMDGIKEMITMQIFPLIKTLSIDSTKIADTDTANRMKASIKQMVEILTKL